MESPWLKVGASVFILTRKTWGRVMKENGNRQKQGPRPARSSPSVTSRTQPYFLLWHMWITHTKCSRYSQILQPSEKIHCTRKALQQSSYQNSTVVLFPVQSYHSLLWTCLSQVNKCTCRSIFQSPYSTLFSTDTEDRRQHEKPQQSICTNTSLDHR